MEAVVYREADCIANLAVHEEDESICKLMPSLFSSVKRLAGGDWPVVEEDCLRRIALLKEDPRICEGLKQKSVCYKRVKLKMESKEKPFLKRCLDKLYEREKSCRMMAIENPYRRGCLYWAYKDKDICIKNFAVEKGGKELCKFIEDEEWQKACELDFQR